MEHTMMHQFSMNYYKILKERAIQDGVQKILAGGVVLNEKGEMLVLTRKDDDYLGGIDELPSGGLEQNEGIYEGLVREIKEETNLDVDRVIGYNGWFEFASRTGKRTREFSFVIIAKRGGEVKITEHKAYKWQTVEDALNNTNITGAVNRMIEVYAVNKELKYYNEKTR